MTNARTVTEVCPDCDIAECHHIRARRASLSTSKQAGAEPVAWMRKWAFDNEAPYKVPNLRGRLVLAGKFKMLPVTKAKIFDDDIALSAAPSAAIAAREQEADWLRELLRRSMGYVKEASTRYYDGTDGASMRLSAANLFKKIDAALASRKEAPATPKAEPVTDAQIAQWAERHDIHGSVGELRAMVGDARTLENADVATPPAAIPAASSEVTDAQIERMTNLAFAATNDRGEMGLQKYWYGKGVREGASLTQPTTVQQADEALLHFAPKLQGVSGPEPTLERIIRRYYIEQIDDEVDAEHFAEDYIAHLRRFLKTAQTTALPGGNGEAHE